MVNRPLTCLMCFRPYAPSDVQDSDAVTVYQCRNCGCERTVSKTIMRTVYGRKSPTLKSLVDQARRLEG